MSPEDDKYYNQLLDTFSTPGWKLIVEKWKEVEQAKDSVKSVPEGGFDFRRGELSILTYMLQFEQAHRDTYDELSEYPDADL